MDEKVAVNKTFVVFMSIIVSTVLLFTLAFLLISGNSNSSLSDGVKAQTDSSGNQVIDLKAKNGFSPKISIIEANKTAILKVDTNNTFDCSSTLSIPKLNINETLPSTGTKEIQIPPQTAGTVIKGTCSMGMYSFQVNVV